MKRTNKLRGQNTELLNVTKDDIYEYSYHRALNSYDYGNRILYVTANHQIQ